VKNGTLGAIDSINRARMAVQLDDGRSVAFDVKDYTQIDHGYAATIHKARGMMVDRTHVLVTPDMDSHAAYVALSRHRDVPQDRVSPSAWTAAFSWTCLPCGVEDTSRQQAPTPDLNQARRFN